MCLVKTRLWFDNLICYFAQSDPSRIANQAACSLLSFVQTIIERIQLLLLSLLFIHSFSFIWRLLSARFSSAFMPFIQPISHYHPSPFLFAYSLIRFQAHPWPHHITTNRLSALRHLFSYDWSRFNLRFSNLITQNHLRMRPVILLFKLIGVQWTLSTFDDSGSFRIRHHFLLKHIIHLMHHNYHHHALV